jgi:glycosyl transferase family 25
MDEVERTLSITASITNVSRRIVKVKNEIKIYVITLPFSKERQDNIKTQFSKQGVNFQFVYGVYGNELTSDEINNLYDSDKHRAFYGENERELWPNEIGCALGHKNAYKTIIENNNTRAIVLEDDVLLNSDFFSIIGEFNNLPIRNRIIKLDVNNDADEILWNTEEINTHYRIKPYIDRSVFAYGYYIDIEAAKTMYSLLSKVFIAADAWRYFKYYVNISTLNKPLMYYDAKLKSIILNGGTQRVTNSKNIMYYIKKFIKNILPYYVVRKLLRKKESVC